MSYHPWGLLFNNCCNFIRFERNTVDAWKKCSKQKFNKTNVPRRVKLLEIVLSDVYLFSTEIEFRCIAKTIDPKRM